MTTVRCEAAVFLWGGGGEGSWHFARIPREASEELREGYVGPPRGFGSVKVTARIGETTWSTSVFPEKETGSYVLPLKKAVRDAEGILVDDVVQVELAVQESLAGLEGES